MIAVPVGREPKKFLKIIL